MHTKSIVPAAKQLLQGAIMGSMGTTLLETTGARLKWARMRQKKTQRGLGHEVGVRDVYISQLESGTYRGSRALMARLASALGVSIAFLEMETDDPYLRVRGQWPALIDDATADRIEAERAARATNRHLADTPHLLSGVAWCMDCNRPLRISATQKGSGKRYIYLRCIAPSHPFWQIRADVVMTYIFAELERLTEADIARLLGEIDAADTGAAALAATLRDIERLQRSLQTADDAHFVAGTLDADRYTRTVQRITAEITTRRAEVERLEAKQRTAGHRDDRAARLTEAMRNGAAILRDADPTAANVWLRSTLRVWLKDKAILIADWL